jgi:hypothetical protein
MNKELKHKEGHTLDVLENAPGSYLCPECGKQFKSKAETELHLHTVHLNHLRTVHREFHGQDVVEKHVN